MAKKKKSGKSDKVRRAADAALGRGEEKRAENRRKNQQMGSLFLYVLLAVIGVVCLFSLVKTLLFPAQSLGELAGSYRFISVVAIPYLILAAAVIGRALLKKRMEDFSDSGKKAAGLLFAGMLAVGLILFGAQLLTGRTEPEQEPVYNTITQALRSEGCPVTPEEDAAGFRSLLETDSMDVTLYGEEFALVLRYHRGSSLTVRRFLDQTRRDYAKLESVSESHGGKSVTVWQYPEDIDTGITVLEVHNQQAILILELIGNPRDSLRLLEILQEAAPAALDAAAP